MILVLHVLMHWEIFFNSFIKENKKNKKKQKNFGFNIIFIKWIKESINNNVSWEVIFWITFSNIVKVDV